jgi:hypothetical protein
MHNFLGEIKGNQVKIIKNIITLAILLILVGSFIINLNGCSESSPISSIIIQDPGGGSTTPSDFQGYEQSDIGLIKILKMEQPTLNIFQNCAAETLKTV